MSGRLIPFELKIKKMIWDEKRHCIVLIEGEQGKGKSTLAAAIAARFDPYFAENMEQRIIIDPEKFLEVVSSHHTGEKLYRGMAWIIDDMGATVFNRTWYDSIQVSLAKVLQTIRYLGLLIIITVPNKDFIDKMGRSLHNIEIFCLDVSFDYGYTLCEIKYLEYSSRKVYKKFLRFRKGMRTRWFWFPRPSKDIMDRYEVFALPFKRGLADRELEKVREGKLKEAVRAAKPNTRCVLCGYEWHYKGGGVKAKCPGCLKYTPTINI